jgi:hypothetical protein
VPLLIESIKELKQEIEELKKQWQSQVQDKSVWVI